MQTKIGKDIQEAVNLLESGRLVAIPTETVYGLAANALNEDAVVEIYNVKNRPQFNPLILHVASINDIGRYVNTMPKVAENLILKFMPGPLTLLLPKDRIVPDLVTAGSKRVAIRVPKHPLTSVLLQQLDFPLAAPSANTSGYVSPTTAQHVHENLHGKIPYILDGGDCGVGVESTIVGFNDRNELVLYRLGGLSVEEIEYVAGKKLITQLSHLQPETPGQLKSHYATNTPLYFGEMHELIAKHKSKNCVLITFEKLYGEVPMLNQLQLSPSGDLQEAAKNLFGILRDADAMQADVILAEAMPAKGLGLAINDRLSRAQFVMKD
jgi:L-threonylcarbamoyladenylate synthase